MLVLSRTEKQRIIVADNIVIEVIEIRRRGSRGDVVRLGITAAPSISVHREEVYEAIQREHAKNAAVSNVKDTEPPELGNSNGVNASAFGCHLCRGSNCVDKQCRDTKPPCTSVRAGDVPRDKE